MAQPYAVGVIAEAILGGDIVEIGGIGQKRSFGEERTCVPRGVHAGEDVFKLNIAVPAALHELFVRRLPVQ